VAGLVTSLGASFTRWHATSSKKDRRVHNSSIASEQSLVSAVSDTAPSALLINVMHNTGADASFHPDAAATPKMKRKRRAGNDIQPFSTTKKLVLLTQPLSVTVLATVKFLCLH